ncbi:MAG: YIP1 family protein [candidate division WOR-3 bacterium]|nr:YIP1 family protein [candidate division WOR-3 bacterium]
MKNFINIFIKPSTVFTGIKEKPDWFKPLAVVLISICIISLLNISTSRDLIIAQQIEAMKERNMTDEQIEQAVKFASGPFIYVSTVIGTIISVSVILMIFALLLNIFIPVAGGEGSYKLVFTVVSYAAMVKIPAYLLRWILIMIKNSLQVSTSLALFVPGLPSKSFAFRLLASFDFFIIWEMILVAMGISITNNLKKENAYILVFAIWIVSIFISIGLGHLFVPR